MTSVDAELDLVKTPLKERYAYLHLAIAIAPSLFKQEELRTTLNELGGFIDSATLGTLRLRASEIERRLDQAIEVVDQHLHPRKPWRSIAAAYWHLSSEQGLSSTHGIQHGWLTQFFDLAAALGVPEDLPYHAQIGMTSHAGTAAVEEEFLLRDSCYILAKLQQHFSWLQRYVKMCKTISVGDYVAITTALAHNVACFARLAVKGQVSVR